ncbi:hypothetical protein [Oleisolibacter albus]|uniref:hypothetical protein n=1 Tax=Oleisolibacter albus TaxID=2171757 RepID=UPI000DF29487|nr:hypothetical protein [Oleisolibacter albus]
MPYILTPAQDTMAIAEREFGTSSPQVQFTLFTSCIGVLSLRNGAVTGVHLSITAEDGTLFDDAAANQVAQIIGQWDQIKVIGRIDYWENPANGVTAAFNNMLQLLGVPPDNLYQLADGIYGGEDDGGTLEITY